MLAGEGDAFSSGHDLGTPEQKVWREAWDARRRTEVESSFVYSWDHFLDMSLRWRDLPKPTIAMVHGWCIFGGWLIASSMDLIVAADDARFLPAHVQYFSVPWDLGARRTKELLWTADVVDAPLAHQLGLVSRVVPRAELLDEAFALARRIAGQDPFTAAMIKRSVNEMLDHQGFRTHITAAHSTFMQMELGGQVTPPGQEGKLRRLPGVERAMRSE